MLKESTKKTREYWNEVRKRVQEKLENNDFEGRIKIDKEVLDNLLFDKQYVNCYDATAKVPVWSGKFLQKIDLSEVDFTNVFWGTHDELAMIVLRTSTEIKKLAEINKKPNFFSEKEELLNEASEYFDNNEEFELSSKEVIKKFNTEFNSSDLDLENIRYKYIPFDSIKYNIDYSNTNANIDLSHSFGNASDSNISDLLFVNSDNILYYCNSCNFENINLYNSGDIVSKNPYGETIGDNYYMCYCNLKNTKFSTPKMISGESVIFNCDLENTDLSNYYDDNCIKDYFTMPYTYGDEALNMLCNLRCCNLRNTGVIMGGMEMFLDGEHSYVKLDSNYENRFVKDYFDDFMEKEYYKGCRLTKYCLCDNKDDRDLELIESKEQIIKYLKVYPQFASFLGILSHEENIDLILDSIDEQIDSKKKQDLNDMLNEKVEMIESSIDEQIKSKQ